VSGDDLRRRDRRQPLLYVGYGQLDASLRNDPRVVNREKINARFLTAADFDEVIEFVSIDVSFIPLKLILPAVATVLRGELVALIKPQFEVGRAGVGKGGVVREAALRRGALVAVGEAAGGLGASVLGFASSGLPGPKGNRETFIWLAEGGREGVDDLERAALEVEP